MKKLLLACLLLTSCSRKLSISQTEHKYDNSNTVFKIKLSNQQIIICAESELFEKQKRFVIYQCAISE